MKVVLIPVAPTDWCSEGRLLGRVEVPPTPAGERLAAAWVEQLRGCGIEMIYHAPDELATRTAKIMAGALGVKTRKVSELAEVDIGLWAGLTDEELRKRFATAHHELNESPLNVNPPAGEEFQAAEQRISNAVQKIVKKNGKAAIALVERPLSLAITRHILEGTDEARIWSDAQDADEPVIVNLSGATAPATRPS